jgi:hypothetical protein
MLTSLLRMSSRKCQRKRDIEGDGVESLNSLYLCTQTNRDASIDIDQAVVAQLINSHARLINVLHFKHWTNPLNHHFCG